MFSQMLRSFNDIKDIIKSVSVKYDDDDNNIIDNITLKYDTYDVELIPEADCCSVSWFHAINNLNELVGKEIEGIIEDLTEDVDLPYSNIQEVDKTHLYYIRFRNSSDKFKFYLTNSSNGYYDGWIHIKINKPDNKPI